MVSQENDDEFVCKKRYARSNNSRTHQHQSIRPSHRKAKGKHARTMVVMPKANRPRGAGFPMWQLPILFVVVCCQLWIQLMECVCCCWDAAAESFLFRL